ncbi:restriction endonuclease [Armatimonas sp.]|uniref:restriction endonuclease n=1 Tax=Armatimonas sp. TaxID=1872638 RepID=UPI00374D4791
MTEADFEALLSKVAYQLTVESQRDLFKTSKEFETRVREVLTETGSGDMNIDFDPHPHVFPDIAIGSYGVEVKFTTNDTWRSVANSIFEGSRNSSVENIYVVFGKMGGSPEVRWGKYDDCVIHVRTSHVPRFEVEMTSRESLFKKLNIEYKDFSVLPADEKMRYIRQYARARLKTGERLWWLEDSSDQEHSLPFQARLYMNLDQQEKRRLRAEAALLCPQIVKPSRGKNKYDDVVLYLLTYHGVLCPQARDLFSAGSVALRSDSQRGGNYVRRALQDIETEMLEAANRLENALFVEYWEKSVRPENRIAEWLARADSFAEGWKPSEVLFLNRESHNTSHPR